MDKDKDKDKKKKVKILNIINKYIKEDWSQKITIRDLHHEPGQPFTYLRYNYHSPQFSRILRANGFVHVASRIEHGLYIRIWENPDLGETYEYVESPNLLLSQRNKLIFKRLKEE